MELSRRWEARLPLQIILLAVVSKNILKYASPAGEFSEYKQQ